MIREKGLIKVIITLTQHPLLGPLLLPYTAESMSDGILQIVEPGALLTPTALSKLTDVERQTIRIASQYAEKSLMTAFSKEKVVSAFFKKLTEASFKKTIRPFIDAKLAEMLKLIRTENLPLYQNEKGNKTLYAHNKIDVSPGYTELLFDFSADDQQFQYSLHCTRNNEPISLLEKKPVVVLTASPATMLLGNELHLFRDINSMRILPFTNKTKVSVSATETDKYLEKITLPILRHHDISSSGLPIVEETRVCEAILSIEESIYDTPTLNLTFRYGDEEFYPESVAGVKSARMVRNADGRASLHYYYRDIETEKQLTEQLKKANLTLIDATHFKLSEEATEKELVSWISANKEMLSKHFRLLSSNNEADYCLDEIRMQQEVTEGRDWFELHMIVTIGLFRIPFMRFRKNILAGKKEYTLPDGRVILLPEEWFSKYTDLLECSEEGEVDDDTIRVKPMFAGLIEPTLNNSEKKVRYQSKERVLPPQKLKAKLRNYQEEGFNWMLHLNKHGFGGCLADDMGLGKTLQTLTLLQHIYDNPEEEVHRPASLVVMPTSLLHNWRKETARFTTLTTYEFTGHGWPDSANLNSIFDRYNLILTSYGSMRKHFPILVKYDFEYIVLDESQHIKNSDSITFKSAILLRSHHRLTLTGTHIENSLKDLWSQFHFVQPELLGTESAFHKQYITPIKQGNELLEKRLQHLIAPFILRRCKEEVAPELPSLTEEIIYCEMTEKQKKSYEKEKNSLRNILLQFNTGSEKASNFTVLNGISHLRQLACHPQMVDSTFTDTSGKLQEIISTFETLRSEGHKVLIFSSYVKHLELVAEQFKQNHWKYALLTGSSTNREEEIRRFSDTEDIQAFLISLKAGGVGLNLTQADYVFIIDPWWNPAAELQAISRAHRIGQNKQVFAYRFITEGSIEEKIIQLQEEKKELFETFISENNPLKSLSDREWERLLEE